MMKKLSMLLVIFLGAVCLIMGHGENARASVAGPQLFEVQAPGSVNILGLQRIIVSEDNYSFYSDPEIDSPVFTLAPFFPGTKLGSGGIDPATAGQQFNFYLMTDDGDGTKIYATDMHIEDFDAPGTAWSIPEFTGLGVVLDFNHNGDVVNVAMTNMAPVPLPATAWIFGTGLLGLIGVGKRRNKK